MADTPNPTPERRALLQALAAQAAAWWRQRLEGHGYLSDFDNGDDSRAGDTARVMASMAALRLPRPNAGRIEQFEQLLTAALLRFLLADPSPHRPEYTGSARYCVLSVDYGPEGLLRQVAQEAQVSGFPWKTTMWVKWDADPANCYVEVRAGYGRDTQRLPISPAPAA